MKIFKIILLFSTILWTILGCNKENIQPEDYYPKTYVWEETIEEQIRFILDSGEIIDETSKAAFIPPYNLPWERWNYKEDLNDIYRDARPLDSLMKITFINSDTLIFSHPNWDTVSCNVVKMDSLIILVPSQHIVGSLPFFDLQFLNYKNTLDNRQPIYMEVSESNYFISMISFIYFNETIMYHGFAFQNDYTENWLPDTNYILILKEWKYKLKQE